MPPNNVDSFEDHCWRDVISPEALELYRHYARETRVGPRPALLAIDLYELVYQGGARPVPEVARQFPSACGEYAYAAIEPTQRLFAAARQAGLPIFYTTGEGRPDAQPGALRVTFRKGKESDRRLYEIKSEFAPQPEDTIVRKSRASAFYGTPLTAQLTQLGVQSLIVCGESTSGCVRASVVDAYSAGFHVTIAEECCFDRHPLSHKVSLFDLHHKYADVMRVDEVVVSLSAARSDRSVQLLETTAR